MTVLIHDDDGSIRGHTSYETTYVKNNEETIEVDDSDLSMIFEDAKKAGETLRGATDSIDAAIDAPLAFLDYLILDSNDAIAFNPEHVREDQTASTSS